MALSTALASALAAGRPQFNARVVEARRRYPGLDTAAFAAVLREDVDVIITAVARIAPDLAARAVSVLYDVALDLVGQGLLGQGMRSAALTRVWRGLIPRYARLVATDPLGVAGVISNAALNVEKTRGARLEAWVQSMTVLADRIESIRQLRASGALAAWCAGLAHLREAALRAADELPQSMALAIVGASANDRWGDVCRRFLDDPWWSPQQSGASRVQRRVEVGGFVGLGGPFAEPPEVRAVPNAFFVRSADRCSLLIADAFGAVLHPATLDEFDRADPGASGGDMPRARGTKVMLGGGTVDLDLPKEGLAIACNEHTVAVTSPYTHVIRLLPRR